jgi:non-specific serine/threonine protein kinase
MHRLRHETANLRVALEYAITDGPPETALRFAADLQNHWFIRGFLSEGRHWLDRRPRDAGAPALDPGQGAAGRGVDRRRAGRRRPGRRVLADAAALAEMLPPSPERAYLPLMQGTCDVGRRLRHAQPLLEQALTAFRSWTTATARCGR